MITLDTFNMVMLAIAVTSIVLNIIQFQTKRTIFKPTYNGLIGLLNDVKNRSMHCYGKQNILFAKDNPHKDIETLKWDFWEFAREVIGYLDGFREHIVAILKTMNPNEDQIFKAADFALTEEDKKIRKEISEEMRRKRKLLEQKISKEESKKIEG